MTEAYDAGAELFKREPDLIMVQVWWNANKQYSGLGDIQHFVAGYADARKRKDDYEREKRDAL